MREQNHLRRAPLLVQDSSKEGGFPRHLRNERREALPMRRRNASPSIREPASGDFSQQWRLLWFDQALVKGECLKFVLPSASTTTQASKSPLGLALDTLLTLCF